MSLTDCAVNMNGLVWVCLRPSRRHPIFAAMPKRGRAPEEEEPAEDDEGEEQELEIDEAAVSACDTCGILVEQHPHLLSVDHLRADCLTLAKEQPEANFLLPWESAQSLLSRRDETRPALLGYVAEVLEQYVDKALEAGCELQRENCAAEYWVQRRQPGEGINWHWDKDEALRDACEAVIHPAVSTVTYLSAGGAPTVLFEVRAAPVEGEVVAMAGAEVVVGAKRRKLPTGGDTMRRGKAFVSFPRKGKLLAFSGGLLHGVAPELSEGGQRGATPKGRQQEERVTLLINVWVHHKPLGTEALPRSLSDRLAKNVHRGRVLGKAAAANVRGEGGADAASSSLPMLDVPVGGAVLHVDLASRKSLAVVEDGLWRCDGVPIRSTEIEDDGDGEDDDDEEDGEEDEDGFVECQICEGDECECDDGEEDEED